MKDDSKDQDSDDGKDDTLKLLNNSFSVNERIDLLMKTFTQELFKKITMAVFEEDKKLVTTMLVMRVMQAENFIEGNLFEFLISGAKKVSTQTMRVKSKMPLTNNYFAIYCLNSMYKLIKSKSTSK